MKIGVVTDIHEDAISLEKAMKMLRKKGCQELICLGDIVGFSLKHFEYFNSRDANLCVDLVQAECNHVVIGNHDLHAAGRIPSAVPGFNFPEGWYDLSYQERMAIAGGKVWLYEDEELSAKLTGASESYLRSLPETRIVDYDGIRILLSHFIHPDITGSLTKLDYSKEEMAGHFGFMRENECIVSLFGHIHPVYGIIANDGGYSVKPAGKYSLGSMPVAVAGPKVMRGNGCGVMMVDLDENTVEFSIL